MLRIGSVVSPTRCAPLPMACQAAGLASVIFDHPDFIERSHRLRLCRSIGYGHDAGTKATWDVRPPRPDFGARWLFPTRSTGQAAGHQLIRDQENGSVPR